MMQECSNILGPLIDFKGSIARSKYHTSKMQNVDHDQA